MTVRFAVETAIAAPPERVFALCLDVDAHQASMARSGERAVAGVTSGQMRLGEQVTWKARHFGITWTMTSRITEFDAPAFFVDEQVSGPFRRFHHQHRFEPSADGTVMTDTIEFDAPFGPIGRLAERIALGRYLPKLIRERNAYLTAVAEDPRGSPSGTVA